MSSGRKFSVALLISVVLFGVFAVLSFAGFFGSFEAKIYQNAVRYPVEQKIFELAEEEKIYNQLMSDKFCNFALCEEVLSLTQNMPSKEDKKLSSTAIARLVSSTPSLAGIRVVGSDGRKIWHSTFESDIKRQSQSDLLLINYEDYDKIVSSAGEIEFEKINCPPEKKYSVYYDGEKRRVVYSVPFTGKDSNENVSRKSLMIFYCFWDDFPRFLYSKNLITLAEKEFSDFISFNGGLGCYVFGLPGRNMQFPAQAREELKINLEKVMAENAVKKSVGIYENYIGLKGFYNLKDEKSSDSMEIAPEKSSEFSTAGMENKVLQDDFNWVVFSKNNTDENGERNCFVAFLYDAEMFEVSVPLKILVLTLIFVTLFLVVFLIFNLRQDDMTVIEQRIKKFRHLFLTEMIKMREIDEVVPQAVLQRKEELSAELIKSLGKKAKKYPKEVNELLEKNWQEILKILSPEKEEKTGIDARQLKTVLQEILGEGTIKIKTEYTPPPRPLEPEEIAPLEEELAEPEEIAPQEEDVAVPEEIVPLEEDRAEPEEIAPLEEDLAEPEEIAPLEEDFAEPEEIAPLEEDAAEPEEIAPLEEDVAEPEEIAPLEEDATDPEEIAPLEENLAEPEEIAPLEENLAEPEEIAPLEEDATEPEEIAPQEEDAAEPEEIEPLEEDATDPEEIAPLEEDAAEPEEIAPLEEDFAEPEEIAPLEEDAAEPEEIAPLEEDVAEPEEIAPLEEYATDPEEIAPLEENLAEPEEIAPLEENLAEPEEIAPLEEDATEPEEIAPQEEDAAEPEEIEPPEEDVAETEEIAPPEEDVAETEEIAPLEDATEPEEIAPLDEDLAEPEEIAPLEEDLAEPKEIAPLEEDAAEPEEIAPLEENLAEPEEIAPQEEDLAEPEEIAPLEEDLAEPEEIEPLEEDAAEPEEIAPLEEDRAEPEEIAPLEEDLAEPEEIEPLEEDAAEPEEIAPLEEDAAEPEEIAPLEEDAAEPEEIAPLEEDLAEPEEIAPPEEGGFDDVSFDAFEDEELKEELKFSSPEKRNAADDTDKVLDFSFNVNSPDFSLLDQMTFEEDLLPENNAVENEKTEEIEETESELEPMESGDFLTAEKSGGILFSPFGAGTVQPILELKEVADDAIVENFDGTFHIEGEPELSEMKLNLEFQNLVDSVMKQQ